MRVFVAEYVSGGGFAQQAIDSVPQALRDEGVAMLTALCEDLASVGQVVVPIDPRMKVGLPGSIELVEIAPDAPLWPQWTTSAQSCDSALIVAPELQGTLAQAVAMLRAGGVEVNMSSGDFLRVASDKWETARCFASQRVPHPQTFIDRTAGQADESMSTRWVVKPRDGCGTESISVFNTLAAARRALSNNQILQTWSPGRAVSVGIIVAGGEMSVLPAVAQWIDANDCHYSGGEGPLDADAQQRVTTLASCALSAMPPFAKGYIGLDLILGEKRSDDCVIEINPRLTTSYVGLRHMVEDNLAARILGEGSGPIRCTTEQAAIRWAPDGRVWRHAAPADA